MVATLIPGEQYIHVRGIAIYVQKDSAIELLHEPVPDQPNYTVSFDILPYNNSLQFTVDRWGKK